MPYTIKEVPEILSKQKNPHGVSNYVLVNFMFNKKIVTSHEFSVLLHVQIGDRTLCGIKFGRRVKVINIDWEKQTGAKCKRCASISLRIMKVLKSQEEASEENDMRSNEV